MIKGIIDRFEGEHAVVEIEGAMKTIKRIDIAGKSREGDVIVFANNKWIIDRPATEILAKEVKELADKLWE